MFSAKSLRCIRQDRVLFEQIDLNLSSGELLQIAGPNGAGKTSLLRILALLSEPDEGELFYQQEPMSESKHKFQRDLCYIGHLSGVQPQLNALENIAFWRACFELSEADDWALLAALGLAGLEDIPCQMLSAGQQRRVSLARLWLTKAKIWILDEPFTALDQQMIPLLQQQFVQHCQQGGGIILTTHQPLDALAIPVRKLALEYRW